MPRGSLKTVKLASSSGSPMGHLPTPNLIAELVERGAVEHRALGDLHEGDRVLVLAARRSGGEPESEPEPDATPPGAGKRQA